MRAEGHRGLVVERQVQIEEVYPGLAGAGPGDLPAPSGGSIRTGVSLLAGSI